MMGLIILVIIIVIALLLLTSCIKIVPQANADGIRFIREAGADQAVLTIKSLEAFEKAADGKATKIIIPSELQSLAGLVKSAKEVIKED